MSPPERPLYLDHNATTPVDAEVVDAMLPYLREEFGNPSGGHPYGRRARAALEDARAKVCVRAASYALSALERCRSVAVPGLRSLNVAVPAPAGTIGRVEVAVQFAAEANRTRRTLVVRRAILTR